VDDWLGRLAARDPGRTLAVLAAITAIGLPVAVVGDERLVSGSGSGSAELRIEVRGAQPVDSPTYAVSLRTMLAQLRADPAVVVAARGPVDPDGRSTSLIARLGGDARSREAAIDRLAGSLDPGPLTIAVRGRAQSAVEAREAVEEELDRLLLALPVIGLLVVGALGTRAAAVAALAAAAVSSAAAALCVATSLVLEISVLALVGAVVAGTLLGLELFALSLWLARPRAVLAAALAAAACFAALALLGQGSLASLALGGGLAALLAAPAARVAAVVAGPARREDPLRPPGSRGWREVAAAIEWTRSSSAAVAVLAGLALLVAAVPATRVAPTAVGATGEPVIGTAELIGAISLALAATFVAAFLSAPGVRARQAAAAGVIAGLPAAAAGGALVLLFQEGRLEGLLSYSSPGALHLGALGAALGTIAALSAARSSALVGAMERTDDPVAAAGLCGPVATIGTVTGAAAGVALAAATPVYIKEFGIGLAIGLVLDLIAVRALAAPAIALLGRRRPAGAG
jgi:hypothetical protein